jgi:FKBP-type peptidyl-prolyl cis-trans isomerase SlyD
LWNIVSTRFSAQEAAAMLIGRNKVVTIDFTMYDEDNEVLETSQEEGPLVYLHGIGELPDGLEEELEGKQSGDEVDVTLEPEAAYGEYDEGLVQAVPREQFDGVEDVEVGMRFEAETDDGPQAVRVIGIEDGDVIVDGNAPYAGMTVRFQVKVLGVRDATSSEIEHGHVHGADGHEEHDHEEDEEE